MKSISSKHIRYVCEDNYIIYMIWALWGTGILLVLFAAAAWFLEALRSLELTALALISNPAQVFIFIVGIITGVYIIQHYVRQGVTRKSFFIGTAAAGLLTAASIQIIGLVLTFLSFGLEAATPFTAGRQLTEYFGASRGYPVTMGITTMVLTAHFLMGWIIGFGFYRYRAIGGFASILLGLVILGYLSVLWDSPSGLVTISGLTLRFPEASSLSQAAVLTAGIMVLQLTMLYRMIRNTPIKVQ